MDNYTKFMERKAFDAAAEDYPREIILDAVGMFRTFAVSLDEFIKEHGYDGDITDISQKTAFIRAAFENAGISPIPRSIKEWYTKDKGISRTTGFQICFAFGLEKEETDDFFRRVMLMKSFDCHVMEEAVYYFCIRRGMDYTKAQEMLCALPGEGVPNVTKSKMIFDEDILFTSAIVKEIDKFQTPEELLAYFRLNAEKFGYNHAGATQEIQKLWEKLRGRGNGLADLEKTKIQKLDLNTESTRSVSEVFKQILGLDEVEEKEDGKTEPLFVIKSDRSIKPLLENNPLLSKVAERQFPNRQTIEKILKGGHVKPESIRKTFILTYFYYFWIRKVFQNWDEKSTQNEVITVSSDNSWRQLITRKNMTAYQASDGDDERFIDGINRMLLEVGYPELYLGNPYDWIFLYCSKSQEPLTIFREFIHEMYLENEEYIQKMNAAQDGLEVQW